MAMAIGEQILKTMGIEPKLTVPAIFQRDIAT